MTTTPLITPLYPSMEIYPASPITNFPPPVVSTTQTLRERCGFNANLRITTGFNSSQTLWSPKLQTQPHKSNLPRRRNPKKRIVFEVQTPTPKFEEPPQIHTEPEVTLTVPFDNSLNAAFDAAHTVPKPEDSDHLQELIPGLHIAFSDGSSDTELSGHTVEKPYTHVVNICYPKDVGDSFIGTTDEHYDLSSRVRKLTIILPASAPVAVAGTPRAGLGLSDSQLRVVRDFLAQALPHFLASQANQSVANVLITTPHRRPTDVMAAAGCYLAFSSGKSVNTVLGYVDEEEDFLSIWKAEVSEDEMERAENIARGWSWVPGTVAGPTV
ncbi:hypothetical protein C8Q75DRAFT_774364 [Abortiporus biennis]|nr:hypothetical protein C8Q75DRAFT_774364 [Abortiporus biennis]